MKLSSASVLLVCVSSFLGSTMAFSPVKEVMRGSPLASSRVNYPSDEKNQLQNNDSGEDPVVRMSEAIPFLPYTPVLASSDLAGNFGFDPLHLASSEEKLLVYREAEMKHGRLAMLVAGLLFTSALLDGTFVDHLEMFFGIPLTMEQLEMEELHGLLSSVKEIPEFWGFCVGLTASSDLYALAKSESGDPDYFPGNLGFDPLGFYPADEDGQKRMQLAEIKHARVAMLAVSYIVYRALFEFLFIDP